MSMENTSTHDSPIEITSDEEASVPDVKDSPEPTSEEPKHDISASALEDTTVENTSQEPEQKTSVSASEDTPIEITSNEFKNYVSSSNLKESKKDNAEIQKQLRLEPTAIVLAKVKGYRAWPAMVLDEAILPENIQKMKPKTVRLARKVNFPVINVPVRFFSDDTYIWIKSCDLKVLSPEEINEFLQKKATTRKHDLLIDAYKLAKDPPDMGEFNTWGSHGPPEYVDSEDEEDIVEPQVSEEPEKKKLKLSIKLKKPVSAGKSAGASKKAAPKPVKSVKPLKSATPVAPAVPVEKKPRVSDFKIRIFPSSLPEEVVNDESLEGFDSDWGFDDVEGGAEGGNYIFDDENEQRNFVQSFPRVAALAQSLEAYQGLFKGLHESVSPFLLREEWDKEKQILGKLSELERWLASSETPVIAFTKSPLFRVLLLTLHKPESKGGKNIRKGIERVLNVMNLQACRITEEDIAVASTENTPATIDGKDETSSIMVD